MHQSPRVLIVDESADSREVLRAIVERQGATTLEAHGPKEGVALAQRYRPELIILDAESDRSAGGMAISELHAFASQFDTPVVILGTLSRRQRPISGGQFIAKPYHYRQLNRKIKSLLASA